MSYRKTSRWHRKDNSVEIFVPAGVYSQEPILVTCCVFLDEYYLLVDLDQKKKEYIITLTAASDRKQKFNGNLLAQSFFNELISNTLRYTIARRNQEIRECVVKEALFFSQPREEQQKVVQRLTPQKDDA